MEDLIEIKILKVLYKYRGDKMFSVNKIRKLLEQDISKDIIKYNLRNLEERRLVRKDKTKGVTINNFKHSSSYRYEISLDGVNYIESLQ